MIDIAPTTPAETGAMNRPSAPAALRAIADWLESHPEFPAYGVALDQHQVDVVKVECFSLSTAGEIAEVVRSIGGRWEKVLDEASTFIHFTQEIAPGVRAEISTYRDRVCERVVTGEKTVTLPAEPAKPERTEIVEIAEWRCDGLLAAASAEAA